MFCCCSVVWHDLGGLAQCTIWGIIRRFGVMRHVGVGRRFGIIRLFGASRRSGTFHTVLVLFVVSASSGCLAPIGVLAPSTVLVCFAVLASIDAVAPFGVLASVPLNTMSCFTRIDIMCFFGVNGRVGAVRRSSVLVFWRSLRLGVLTFWLFWSALPMRARV